MTLKPTTSAMFLFCFQLPTVVNTAAMSEKCPNPKKNRTLPRLKKMMRLWVVKVPTSGSSGCRKSACSGRLVVKNRYLHNYEKNHGDYRYKSERHANAQE